jgi:hypothetical protein
MHRPPNNDSMRNQFIQGLPVSILKQLMERGIAPDMASVKVMMTAVLRIESNRKLTDYYVSGRKELSTEYSDDIMETEDVNIDTGNLNADPQEIIVIKVSNDNSEDEYTLEYDEENSSEV